MRQKSRLSLPALAVILTAIMFIGCFATKINSDAASGDTITFSDSGITYEGSGEGYEIDGTALTITAAGTYTVTGSCSEGSITVKKGVTDVYLIMDDLTLSSSTTAPFSVKKTCEVTLELSGTSTLTDAEDATTEDTNEDFEGAAIKVKSGSTLTITGSGTLNIDASDCKNGIKGGSEATINIESGTINVDAANTGIACDNVLNISGGTFNITAENEGIKAEPDEDDTVSAGALTLSGGTYTITSADDAIHALNELTITGGTYTINAGDDAIHCDYTTTIGTNGSEKGPDITIESCVEGIEGATVNLYSGSASLVASDDGINAANSDLSDYSFAINITGGTWTVNAQGDGIDSNKDLTISGGTTEVFGSTDGGNGSLDFDGTGTLTGGTVLAVGNSGMAQNFSSGLTLVYSNVSVSKGTSIVIKNSSGSTVYSSTGVKSANHIIFASASLSSSDTYTLYLGGTASGSATTSQSSQQGGPGGQQGDPGGQQGGPGGQQGGGTPPSLPGQETVTSYSSEWVDGQWYAADGTSNYSYQGSWKHNSKGWWYEDESGWYPVSKWQKIDGKWYYFDEDGYMESSCYRGGYWLTKSGAWDSSYKGSWKHNSKGWWYQDISGWYPTSRWLKIDGKWYYFYASGYMAADTTINGYYVDSTGAWVE